jgi:hypothetical protein
VLTVGAEVVEFAANTFKGATTVVVIVIVSKSMAVNRPSGAFEIRFINPITILLTYKLLLLIIIVTI